MKINFILFSTLLLFSFKSYAPKEKELSILLSVKLDIEFGDGISYDMFRQVMKKKKLEVITLDDAKAMLQRQMGYVLEPYIRDKKGIPSNLDELMSREPAVAKKVDFQVLSTSNIVDSIIVQFRNWGGVYPKQFSKTFINSDSLANIVFIESCIDSCIARKYFFESYRE